MIAKKASAIAVVLITCSMSSFSAFAEKPSRSAVAKTFDAELKGKFLYTKRELPYEFIKDNSKRWVDTEFYPSGETKYMARFGGISTINGGITFDRGGYVSRNEISTAIDAGTQIKVTQIVYGEDRIEVWVCNAQNSASCAKAKLMLGKGYDGQPIGPILEFTNTVFTLPDIEAKVALERDYTTQKSSFDVINTQLARSQNDPQKLQALQSLESICDQLAISKGKLQSNGDTIANGDTTDYAAMARTTKESRTALEEKIAIARKAREKVRSDARIAQEHITVSDCARDLTQHLDNLDKIRGNKPADIAMKTQLVELAGQKLQACTQAQTALAADGSNEPEADRAIAEAPAHLKRFESALASARARAQFQAFETQYAAMNSQLADLEKKLIPAFATPQEGAIRHDIISHLEAMIANREQAKLAGDPVAGPQIPALQAKLKKYQ